MSVKEKELAFLRDLYVSSDWTERFTKIFDENFKLAKDEKVLYFNAGTGNHALALREKMKKGGDVFAVCENESLRQIAQAKADTMHTKISFSTDFPTQKFETIIADLSFIQPNELEDLVEKLADFSQTNVVFFLVSAHSFGEVFSFLWETLFNLGLPEKGAEVERLISELPTVAEIEKIAENVGLRQVTSFTKNEIFEFKDGAEFVNSPLIANFLLPKWLAFLNEKERKKVIKNIIQTIDKDDQDLTFRFSVKATLVQGRIE